MSGLAGRLLRALLLALGVMLSLIGALWVLQGLGIVQWPEDSFMVAERQWAVTGAMTMATGVALIVVRRWLRPHR